MEIRLVPPCPSFADSFHKWRREEKTVKFNPIADMSIEEVHALLVKTPKSLAPLADGITHRWFVECHGKVIGVLSLTEVNTTMGTGQIGYTIGAASQGKGIATIALGLWTQLLFENTQLRKLTALVNEHNIASLRVLEKCGYKREGFLKEHFIIRNKPSNQVLFGLLRSEWVRS